MQTSNAGLGVVLQTLNASVADNKSNDLEHSTAGAQMQTVILDDA